ncbi:lysine transporter LysE [Flavobacterium sp. MFBS3-15]|uniref:lysine transporter LysE n=1 Tax=Flavobacterium sp. MFBS3-15 TaxID=2989816 RepID=UPI0022354648|nr:lysine transporter LysE [Flavobacterium sp. MFBS3-15]MCW4468619.1 lysine transporter LysE [Flavobacterium sp. MFBS3-15]
MNIVLPLFLGLGLSSVGVALPGLLNMTAAKISLKEGRQRALIFATGAATIVFFQTYIAVSFAKFLYSRPDIIKLLEETGLIIFTLLTLYFFLFAKKKKMGKNKDIVKLNSRTSNFFLGALLSVLNFFPIPYYVFVSVSLSAYKYFYFSNLFVFLFVMGVVAGSFLIFYLYIVFFKKFEHKADFFMRNVNYFLGSVTGLVAILTLIKILRSQ